MKKSNLVSGIIATVLAVLLVSVGAFAYQVSRDINVAGNYNFYEASSGQTPGVPQEPQLGRGVGDTVEVTEFIYGPGLSVPLNFSRGATTTPGALFKILNAGSDKICGVVEIDITDASDQKGTLGTGNALAFAVGTSTAASAWSTATGGIIASTTVATNTEELISSVKHAGTYVNADQDIGGNSWRWGKGVYLLGAFDDAAAHADGSYATSSDVYTTMTGRAYVFCHVAP